MSDQLNVAAKDVRRRGVSIDGRAHEYDWRCGRFETKGDMVDDFMGTVKHKQCPPHSCGAVNRIEMGPT